MPTLEQWLVTHALEIIIAIITGALIIDRTRGKSKQMEKTVARNKEVLDEHLAVMEFPHASCRVESERLRAIQQNLEGIFRNQAHFDKKLDSMQDRIIEVIMNGKPRHENDE